MRVRVKPVPAGARPMRRTSTSPPSPSRISEADFTGTPSETGDLTGGGSGVVGAEGEAAVYGRSKRKKKWFL